jgi:hypothetical protein
LYINSGKLKGSIIYFSGFMLIVIGFSFLGTVVELIGFLIIFRQFLPDFYDYICKIPVAGKYLSKFRLKSRKLYDSKHS